jgi:hypothetical protein
VYTLNQKALFQIGFKKYWHFVFKNV